YVEGKGSSKGLATPFGWLAYAAYLCATIYYRATMWPASMFTLATLLGLLYAQGIVKRVWPHYHYMPPAVGVMVLICCIFCMDNNPVLAVTYTVWLALAVTAYTEGQHECLLYMTLIDALPFVQWYGHALVWISWRVRMQALLCSVAQFLATLACACTCELMCRI